MYEWVHHHFMEGIDKIYMIDDNSDDNYLGENKWLLEYQKKGKIKLLKSKTIQQNDYNRFLRLIKRHKWIIQIDIDEFIFCPFQKMNLKKLLNKYLNKYDYIIIRWKLFSHRVTEQPKSVIKNNIHTHNKKKDYTSTEGIKCIGKTRFLKKINIHQMRFKKKVKTLQLNDAHNSYIQLNHYRTQSDEYVYGVKEQRGGGVNKTKYLNPDERHKSFSKICLFLKEKRIKLINNCIQREQVKPQIYKNSSWFMKNNK
jgi:hypothetical protein